MPYYQDPKDLVRDSKYSQEIRDSKLISQEENQNPSGFRTEQQGIQRIDTQHTELQL